MPPAAFLHSENASILLAAPDPTGRAYRASPDPLAGLNGPTSKGKGGRGGEGRDGRGEIWTLTMLETD